MIWYWQHRECLKTSLNSLYRCLGITKQAMHQLLDRRMAEHCLEGDLLVIIRDVREDHPTMSCRAMYFKIKPQGMGRDVFELFCRREGFGIERLRQPWRTTDSNGVVRFENLLEGLVLTAINQAYSSDITYYEVGGVFYYLTFIMDCYSRVIIGHSVSKRLTTETTTMAALERAIRFRGGSVQPGIVFHSDGGGQYYDKEFLKLTTKHGFKNSMCEYPWENGKAERINGTIKNNYLKHRKIDNFESLLKEVDRSVSLYNLARPHKSLGYLIPMELENSSRFVTTKPADDEGIIQGKSKCSMGLSAPSSQTNPASESGYTLSN